jgi:hypothetical protein
MSSNLKVEMQNSVKVNSTLNITRAKSSQT